MMVTHLKNLMFGMFNRIELRIHPLGISVSRFSTFDFEAMQVEPGP
jgi:hypothetical protein